MDSQVWRCVRQRAGPLVKEYRALRPRFSGDDSDADRKAKSDLKRRQNGAFDRRRVDRLELRLALFGRSGTMHTLTFDDDHLPRDFKDVRRALRSFFRRAQRWRASLGKPPPFDYIYCIEGLHREHRYHVHLVTRDGELCSTEIRHLWKNGFVDDAPVLRATGGYRRLAEYLNKERTDGVVIPVGRHPWSCSRTLNAQLPPPEKWRDESGDIPVPVGAVWVRRGSVENDFGAYRCASYILPDARGGL